MKEDCDQCYKNGRTISKWEYNKPLSLKCPIGGCVSNLWHKHKLCFECGKKLADTSILNKIETNEKYNKNEKKGRKVKISDEICILKY
jgi:hypothetical protein